jgi:hypothetical protein
MAAPFELQLTLAPPEILGRRLAPFSLGHAHLLEIAGSPFVGAAATSTAEAADLVLAAWLLTFPTYAAAKAAAVAALAGNIPSEVKRWGRRIGPVFDLAGESIKLATYIGKCTKPPRTAKRENAKPLATPAAATLAVLHRRYFSTPAAEAWDLPFLDALLDVMTFHHAQGWVDLISDKRADFIDRVAAGKAGAK